MKQLFAFIAVFWLGLIGVVFGASEPDVAVKELTMTGEVKGENVTFTLRFQLKGVEAGSRELGGQDEWSTGKRGGPNDGVGCR